MSMNAAVNKTKKPPDLCSSSATNQPQSRVKVSAPRAHEWTEVPEPDLPPWLQVIAPHFRARTCSLGDGSGWPSRPTLHSHAAGAERVTRQNNWHSPSPSVCRVIGLAVPACLLSSPSIRCIAHYSEY